MNTPRDGKQKRKRSQNGLEERRGTRSERSFGPSHYDPMTPSLGSPASSFIHSSLLSLLDSSLLQDLTTRGGLCHSPMDPPRYPSPSRGDIHDPYVGAYPSGGFVAAANNPASGVTVYDSQHLTGHSVGAGRAPYCPSGLGPAVGVSSRAASRWQSGLAPASVARAPILQSCTPPDKIAASSTTAPLYPLFQADDVYYCAWSTKVQCTNAAGVVITETKVCSEHRAFKTLGALNKHQRYHLPEHERPHPCLEPGCTRRFLFPNDLEDHRQNTHGGVKLFCPVCGQAYTRHDNRSRHMRQAHPGAEIPGKRDPAMPPYAVASIASMGLSPQGSRPEWNTSTSPDQSEPGWTPGTPSCSSYGFFDDEQNIHPDLRQFNAEPSQSFSSSRSRVTTTSPRRTRKSSGKWGSDSSSSMSSTAPSSTKSSNSHAAHESFGTSKLALRSKGSWSEDILFRA